MIVARENPKLRVELNVESSNVLIEQLAQGKLDIMIGRLFERQDKTGLRYERLAEEPVCAVVRPGHPLLNVAGLTLAAVEKKPWIVPPSGSVLRHRFDLMFREAGLAPPAQLIETASLLFVTKMLQQTDFISVVPTEVARYYATYGMVAILPMTLSCTMDAFGIITRTDWLLSPAANVLLRAMKTSAVSSYGCPAGPENRIVSRARPACQSTVSLHWQKIIVRVSPRFVRCRRWTIAKSAHVAVRNGLAAQAKTDSCIAAGSRTRAIRTTCSMAARSSASAIPGVSSRPAMGTSANSRSS